jgi:hypothetical protein
MQMLITIFRSFRFLCQTSSLDFLIGQGFDFNKLIRDGVSYLRPAELGKKKHSMILFKKKSLCTDTGTVQ